MLDINELPKMNMDNSQTGCCPKFDDKPWNEQMLTFQNKRFAKVSTKSIWYIPINMDRVMSKAMAAIEAEKAQSPDHYLMLSQDTSPWRCDQYFMVEKDVPGMEMVNLTGAFLTKTFEGPYQDVPKWIKEMEKYVVAQGKTMKEIYYFCTTCPKCAKTYGKNHVVLFAQV